MRLFVPLTKTEYEALRELARIERRRPQEQAASMLAKALAGEPQAWQASREFQSEMTANSRSEAQRVPA